MALYFEIAGNQIDGARDYQEDAFLTNYVDDSSGEHKTAALVIMADGMGGHAAGNIASNLVVTTFSKTFSAGLEKRETPLLLRESLLKSNDALKASIQETPQLDGMGCTMVSAAFLKGKMWWISVGDSHLYLLRDGSLAKKNEDHSYGGYLDRMKAQGVEVEAEAGLSRNMLMSAMTGDEIADIDCPSKPFELKARDRVIVASDGLDTLEQPKVLELCTKAKTPKECVEGMLKEVEAAQKPRQDNTTVIVIDVAERAHDAPVEHITLETPPGEREPEARPAAPAKVRVPAMSRLPDTRARKGLVIGVVSALLVAGGVGAWFIRDKLPLPEGLLDRLPRLADLATPQGTSQSASQPAPEPEPVEPRPQPEPKAQARLEPEPEPEPEAQAVREPEPQQVASALSETRPGAAPGGEFRDPLRIGGRGPLMVRIRGGTFQMGSPPLSTNLDERPQHEVRVESFAMSKYEVTFADYEKFARATGRGVPDNQYMEKETHPVIFVSWDDAYNYTRWLSAQTGQSYRLPSEAEWEYAASARASTPYWWGYEMKEDIAHCFDCKTGLDPRKPTRVGRFGPNPFGLHDTAGNVHEWVHDCYHGSYEGAPSDGSVWEGGDCSYRVARGGAFDSPSPSLRHTKRTKLRATNGYDSVGIRLVRDL
ncbi:MAG: SUMF1/EgtB/PvdO family nonheme iron enzyme [Gammaproteobacteria bacterium]|nr:SUMF1/EgtB/PvdO family nonheme iron enzyme [Gammaproteobacteria bacterium]NIR83356.1 SUMF1/EgtB/PvdO family nonheme iron enzyme [Gammaproteobacteria bacterium]NIR91156.1 SUMF1/EgtB/PvdO family nonheme iron enzyme [Gammaproteobacteria bacterium]NIU04523.1 SUMF1/EgtB/PvdO family nonheme iron enzyme [Gammaproteobacteria bacterium]NIW87159.1 SUMF1/EgtB/PvdO family nonheme iron enzyme [Gammaproteobacteria bacterium]